MALTVSSQASLSGNDVIEKGSVTRSPFSIVGEFPEEYNVLMQDGAELCLKKAFHFIKKITAGSGV